MAAQTRRQFIGTLASAAGTAASAGWTRAGAQERRPANLVLIMADDLSARELGCYGHAEHRTPNLDRLAETGVMFRTCWATPICSPSRAAIMTGRYGFRTGWFHNNLKPRGNNAGYDLAKTNVLFSELLQEAGDATGIMGKWQLSGQFPTLIYEYGFDEYCMWAESRRMLPEGHQFDGPIEEEGMSLPGRNARYWHPAVVRNGEWMPTQPDDYGPDLYTDFLIDFMRRNRDGHFLAYYPMCLPHMSWDFELAKVTYVPAPELDGNGQKTGRRTADTLQSNVEYIDHLIGRIVDALDETGLRDNTVILFTGDNGTGGYGKNRPDERGARVPLICNCPGLVQPRGASDELVSFVDILPTLADFAGAPLPQDWELDGVSFAPYLRGESDTTREWIFSYLAEARMIRDRRWYLAGNGRLFDCGDSRDIEEYTDVTESDDPAVKAAWARLEGLLADLPGPTEGQRQTAADPGFSILKPRTGE